MELPETFLKDLSVEFQDRLRARWSGRQQAIIVEQRVGRNILPSLPRTMYSDERRQSLAEGYMPILTVSASEQIRCPECAMFVEVPNRETQQVRCWYCASRGRTTRITAGFYPLNSSLINHLKSIDPLRNMESDDVAKMQEYNEKLIAQRQAEISANAEAYTSDNINRLMGILQTGYSGTKVKEGTDIKGFS